MAKRKKKMLDIMVLLNDANHRINDYISKRNAPEAESLAGCQEMAIRIGNLLETYGNDGEKFVHMLEDYCEYIYQISISHDMAQCRKLMKKIRKLMAKVYNGIRFEIQEDRKEIVFLPYKASMWDSLESVWRAAINDERCDVYVVPIPYFDRRPDGTLGEMHYEGGEYPEYVSVTFWKEFSIEEHMPDVIYIHNPYDQNNYVTSVHPDFYAAKLRKYTDKLVYIPYFTSLDSNIPQHLVVVPGVLYAHNVIVQSEKARRIYIKALHEFEKQNHCENFFGKQEDKILALGSPKYDKVLLTKKENISIPPDWQKIMESQVF